MQSKTRRSPHAAAMHQYLFLLYAYMRFEVNLYIIYSRWKSALSVFHIIQKTNLIRYFSLFTLVFQLLFSNGKYLHRGKNKYTWNAKIMKREVQKPEKVISIIFILENDEIGMTRHEVINLLLYQGTMHLDLFVRSHDGMFTSWNMVGIFR